MRSADPGGRAGGCIGRAPAESGTRMYCGSVVVAPAVSAGAIFFIKIVFSKKTLNQHSLDAQLGAVSPPTHIGLFEVFVLQTL